MNLETWKLLASVAGVLLTVVTGPLLWAFRAEAGKIRAEIKNEVGGLRLEMVKEFAAVRSEFQSGLAEVRTELRTGFAEVRSELKDAEHRLNERIDTRLIHR